VLTTNFDRLLEQALTDEGISPTVISTPDAIEGALPLVHQGCCIVKLHGDYRDSRIRNTANELTSYDDRTSTLLARILVEFGLIVCGWSGDWDHALRAALERCTTQRFSLYWSSIDKPKDTALRLIKARAGRVITGHDADTFFDRLAQAVLAIEESRKPNARATELIVALTKRFLAAPDIC
jgi:hypothetical protein